MKRVKLVMYAVVALLLPALLTACSGNSGVKALIESIPGGAPGVLVINFDKTQDKLGLDIPGSNKLLKEWVGKSDANEVKRFLNPKNGLDSKYFVVYLFEDTPVVTASVNDADALKDIMTKIADKKPNWIDSGNVSYCRDLGIILSDSQIWFCTPNSSVFDHVSILSGVKQEDSFVGKNQGVFDMLDLDAEATAMVNIKSLSKWASRYGGSDGAQFAAALSMGNGAMASNLKYLGAKCDLDADELDLEVRMFDSNGKQITANIDWPAIDAKVLQNNLSQGDLIVAAAVDHDLIAQILNQFGAIAGSSEMQMVKSLVKGIDGTCAVSVDDPNEMRIFSAVVSTTSPSAATELRGNLSDLLDEVYGVKYNFKGKQLCISSTEGDKLPASVADLMKGANIAVYLNAAAIQDGCDYALLTVDFKDMKYNMQFKLKKGMTFAKLISKMNNEH